MVFCSLRSVHVSVFVSRIPPNCLKALLENKNGVVPSTTSTPSHTFFTIWTIKRQQNSVHACQGLVVTESEFDLAFTLLNCGSNVGWQTLQKTAQRLGSYDTTAGTSIQDGMGRLRFTGVQGRHLREIFHLLSPGRLHDMFRMPELYTVTLCWSRGHKTLVIRMAHGLSLDGIQPFHGIT